MCGPLFWGVWWIVPLVGFAMCLGVVAFRFLGTGRGIMSAGGGHHSTPADQLPQSNR